MAIWIADYSITGLATEAPITPNRQNWAIGQFSGGSIPAKVDVSIFPGSTPWLKLLSATKMLRTIAWCLCFFLLVCSLAQSGAPSEKDTPLKPEQQGDVGPSSAALANCKREFKVVLDVGHTPQLPGTPTARGRTEYEFNLILADFTRAVLSGQGYKNVYLIKMNGGLETLERRVALANKLGANLLISIHHDSVQPRYLQNWIVSGKRLQYSDRFSGYSLFVSEKNPRWREGLAFATLLADQLLSRSMHFTLHHAEPIRGESREWLDKTRGIYRYDDLVVLKGFQGPAVLLEAAVVVNREEELVASSELRHQLIAEAIANAVGSFCESQITPAQ